MRKRTHESWEQKSPALGRAPGGALAVPLGVTHIDMPATPARIWRAISQVQALKSERATLEDDPLRAHKPARRQNGRAEEADGLEARWRPKWRPPQPACRFARQSPATAIFVWANRQGSATRT
jgi:hypothetical protein